MPYTALNIIISLTILRFDSAVKSNVIVIIINTVLVVNIVE